MECIRAQELVSDALDKVPVDSSELIDAKDHCRGCPECNAFVRALVAVKRAPLPEPPADLPDRVMEAVRADIALTGMTPVTGAVPPVESRGGNEAADGDPYADPLPYDAPISMERLSARVRDPRHRRALVAWGSAAAVVFIVAGFAAITGVRSILVPRQATEITMSAPTASAPNYAAESAPQAGAADKSGAVGEAATSGYIVVNGTTYLARGEDGSVDVATLSKVGTTASALDTGGSPVSYDVLAGPDPNRAYIELEDGRTLAFERVMRDYDGRTYVLQSGDISAYGQWPSLPPNITPPTAEDGSPTFTIEESDASGVVIYRLVGSTADAGFALPPNSGFGPGWTWWTAAQ